jgi:hypothetical protein
MHRFVLLLFPLAFVLLTGCGTVRGQAKATGAQALGCPTGSVVIESHPGAEYTVSGCGGMVDVDCKDPSTVDRSQNPEGHTVCRANKPR